MKLKINKIHFPTALGLFLLLMAVGIGFYFVKTRSATTNVSGSAAAPKQVRLTNVTDSGFSVSWVTDQAATGKIKLGTDEKNLKNSILDDRDQLSGEVGNFEIHHLTTKNLQPDTKFYFKIESNGNAFDNQGKPFEITTGPALGNPPPADPVYGTIMTSGKTPAESVVVYINLANAAPMSALVKSAGNWAVNLSTVRTTDLKNYLNYDSQASIINILVQGGKLGTAPAITTTANDNPVPEIILGQSHDFRNQTMAATNTQAGPAEATSSGKTESTGFSLDPLIAETNLATPSGTVTLDNPSVSGEIINATQPAFMGSGPPGTVLAIEIHSDTYTGTATIDQSGDWEFIPPQGLSVGNHSISIAYLDAEGVEQTLTRNFVIAAAGESEIPAIVATPSATVASNSGRTSMPSTASGVPHPGGAETSLLLLLTGFGLIIYGLQLKKVV